MPELPEVETVRAGAADHLLGRPIAAVEVLRDRSVRRQEGGPAEFVALLTGRTLDAAVRRGKFLWLPLRGADGAAEDHALLVHLGMSGQLLVTGAGENPHLRVRITFADGGQAWFVDQRTFGYLTVADLVPTTDGGPGGLGAPPGPTREMLPAPVAHIGRDLLDPLLADPAGPGRAALIQRLRRGRRGIKRALLDQNLVSGIGNIYADEALWRAKVHYDRRTDTMPRAQMAAVLEAAAEVMRTALAAGGTSFDALYVNVNGASGYFDRSLNVYGREGLPCPRCGTPIRRESFMNRSAAYCPRCQRRPRSRHPAAG
ncbi:MAG TPA: bifunctional DNA-formamidopyrimidine glycosylase/DNA-(apurinic or apyrimidinic site) lyase [Candidatus Ruania gallistercoris]|uniref:Bifunctional DNA-formamidopyrimidine glycosylase/DNA-(Apurinic or apyrimidinic site) lyase n=1 Tax=Candidatus Ruania gallistercoris TaxID=2838746 RepID=A0A9D2EBZ2_9MICO|nr:bifunctional DNA-formamidopyrimidine glycosylase/DNA-(apurinic or apyrimidinic site) lyase [Candidatus Ruania gallistercoris]